MRLDIISSLLPANATPGLGVAGDAAANVSTPGMDLVSTLQLAPEDLSFNQVLHGFTAQLSVDVENQAAPPAPLFVTAAGTTEAVAWRPDALHTLPPATEVTTALATESEPLPLAIGSPAPHGGQGPPHSGSELPPSPVLTPLVPAQTGATVALPTPRAPQSATVATTARHGWYSASADAAPSQDRLTHIPVTRQALAETPTATPAATLGDEVSAPFMAPRPAQFERDISTVRSRVPAAQAIAAVRGDVPLTGTDLQLPPSGGPELNALAPRPTQPAVAVTPLPPLVGDSSALKPAWDQALGQRIVHLAHSRIDGAELRLDPPHLGTIQVRIAMNEDQAQVFFQASHPAARDALESALPRLRDLFAQEGLQLDSAQVGERDSGTRQDARHANRDATADLPRAGSGENPSAADEAPGPASVLRHATRALVDEFV